MKQTKAAFSMVEMVVVLVIIGLVAGIAMPRFGQAMARQKLDAAVRRVTADLKYAQKRATQTSTPQTVMFDITSGIYILNQTPDPNNAAKTYMVDLSMEPYHATISDVEFRTPSDASGDPVVIFDIYGTPDSGGTLTITVGEKSTTMTINPQTGKVTTSHGLEPSGHVPINVVN